MLIRILLVCSALFTTAAFAEQDQSAAQLRKYLDAMTTLQGKFSQSLFGAKGEKLEESQGSFALQRPGKFYWKTEAPFPQLLVSNNKTIWLYDPDLETVNERPFTNDLQQTPALLLSEDIDKLRQNFTVTHKEGDKNIRFTLVPKVTDGLFQQLILVFAGDDLKEFHIQDSLGQSSQFMLGNIKRNQPLDASLFEFTPPPGVEILRN
ncbi:MAG TPA: outer membrane lipoprotein chaperone LolA [Cellvibrio sp.]|nr:outer membrane lipoprotein chaperone LolA [Cellvibrio sp.]